MLRPIEIERASRVEDLINNGKDGRSRLLEKLNNSKEDKKTIKQLDLLDKANITHAGLTQAQYFCHLTRIVEIIKTIEEKPSFKLMQLGLMHNMKEVSCTRLKDMMLEYNEEQEHLIDILTIDRKQQYNSQYLNIYYEKISSSELASKIKCIDKLDNLFMIGLNKDSEVRDAYILQIEEYISPLIGRHYPSILRYVMRLIDDARETGFRENDMQRITKVTSKGDT